MGKEKKEKQMYLKTCDGKLVNMQKATVIFADEKGVWARCGDTNFLLYNHTDAYCAKERLKSIEKWLDHKNMMI